MTRTVLTAAAMLALAAPAAAQVSEATLEASVVRGALGYARQLGGSTLWGVEAGFGFPQFDRTLKPREFERIGEADFEEYLHVAALLRHAPGEHFELDTGVRAAIVDVWPCGASDCWPVPFGGGYVQPMVGWKSIKVGARLVAGWAGESESGGTSGSTFVVALSPFLVRATLRW